MPLTGAFVFPHPPIILPEVGKGEQTRIQKTIDSFRKAASVIAELKPDTIVVSTPHSVAYQDYFHISPGYRAKGDMSRFGAPGAEVFAKYDAEFVFRLEALAKEQNIMAGTLGERSPELDHGTVIPLLFVNEVYTNYKLIRIGLSGFSPETHYRLGKLVAETSDLLGRNTVFIASGDLSHKLTRDGPYGWVKEGGEFDSIVTAALSSGDFITLLGIPEEFAEKAAECGLKSFLIMAGALDGKKVKSNLLSYEGPFGVGYAVAVILPEGEYEGKPILEEYKEKTQAQTRKTRENESEPVRLARHFVESYIKTKTLPPFPGKLSGSLTKQKAGVFVTLKINGKLRGCMGTIKPAEKSVAEEIKQNAVTACSRDPRFDRVREDELERITYSVDILSPPEAIDSPALLDVRHYGVIVSSGERRGLLLPDLTGVDTVEEQISIARQKAGIRENEKINLERFKVVRHT